MKIYFHLNLAGISNCYIVINETTKEAIMIDPCKINQEMIKQLEIGPFNLVAALLTHNHKSHIRGLNTLKKIYNPKIFAADFDLAGTEETILKGDGTIHIAGFDINYYALPGHSPDSMAYKIEKKIFIGDAISAGLLGNTSSSYARRTLISNLNTKIMNQHDSIILMPGHGPPVTIGAEKKFNPAFQ